MQSKTISQILNRVFKGKATHEEEELVSLWYERLDLENGLVLEARREELKAKMAQNLFTKNFAKVAAGRYPGRRWLQVAASLLLLSLITVGLVRLFRHQTTMSRFLVTTGRNQLKTVVLPDQTQVTLNASSSLSWDVAFGRTERRVQLSGEAFFNVRKDRHHPFIVLSKRLETVVLGTAFDVEAYPLDARINVSVVRGHVKVFETDVKANGGKLKIQASLLKGQMVAYECSKGTSNIKVTAVAEPEAWARGALVFNDISLVSAISRIEERFDIRIAYDPVELSGKTVTAIFRNTSWVQILNAICFMHNLHYAQDQGTVYIKKNQKSK